MNRGRLIQEYFGLVRKHWIPAAIIAVVVLVGGYLYLSRQAAVFEASAKLKIIRRPHRRTPSDVSFSFEEDQFFYNTQYNLLTTQLDWADQALDRAALLLLLRLDVDWEGDPDGAGGVLARTLGTSLDAARLSRVGGPIHDDELARLDEAEDGGALRRALDSVRREVILAGWGFNPDALLSRVTAAPIPNTYLAKLTLRAGDPGVAVYLVNIYSEFYRDVSREEREETLGQELRFRDAQRAPAMEKLQAAQRELEQFLAEHRDDPELALDEPVNLAQQQVGEIARKLTALQTERIIRREEEEDLLRVLTSRGVEVDAPEDGPLSLALRDGVDGGAGLTRFLAEDLPILGLPAVEQSASVALLRSRLRALEEEESRLRRDFTEESDQIREVRRRRADASRELGSEVSAAILRYLEKQRRDERSIAELERRLEQTREEARELNELYGKLAELRARVETLREEKAILDREYTALLQLQSMKAEATGGPLAIQNIAVERRARLLDARQVKPRTTLILLLTIFASAFLSIGSAFLLEYLDDTIKSKEDFARLVSVPDIGFIPRIGEKEFERQEIAVRTKPQSIVAEAFRTVRTGILFSRRDEEIKSFLITSAGPGEGKTTVSVNLAITMAEAGRGRVLLIDADLRKSRIHAALGIDNHVGLTNCLVGSESLSAAVQETEIENLFVLTSGPTPPNPAELLGGIRAGEILSEAKESFARVILDTPPLVPVTDTCLLAAQVDGVFLVISVGKTSWRLVQRGKEALDAVGVKPSGAILNNTRARYHGYGYAPYYQSYSYSRD